MENLKKESRIFSVTATTTADLGGQHMPGFHESRSLLHFSQDISLEHLLSQ